MSNMFYNYISGKIIDYFRVNVPKAGDKFYVQFETDKQVKCLYNELNNNTISSPFVYEDCKFCSNGTPILKLAVHPF